MRAALDLAGRAGDAESPGEALETAPPPAPDCAFEALAEASAFYKEGLISSTDRNGLRELLARDLSESCTADGRDLAALDACIALYGRTYSEGAIAATTKNALVNEAAEPYVGMLVESEDTDAALERIDNLYALGAISAVNRNELREAVLAAE